MLHEQYTGFRRKVICYEWINRYSYVTKLSLDPKSFVLQTIEVMKNTGTMEKVSAFCMLVGFLKNYLFLYVS